MKKIVCILTAFMLVLSIIGCSKKDVKVKISVENAEVKAGSKVEIPVKIEKNPGIMAFLIDFEYDTDVLEFIEVKKGNVFTDFETSNNDNGVRVNCIEDKNIKKNGEMMILVFKAVGEKGEKTKLTPALNDNSICNYDEEFILGEGKGATVKIK